MNVRETTTVVDERQVYLAHVIRVGLKKAGPPLDRVTADFMRPPRASTDFVKVWSSRNGVILRANRRV